MNKNNKILTYLLIFIIIVLAIFGVSQYFTRIQTEKLLKDYKVSLIEADSLRKISDNHYQRLVNDTKSQKDLFTLVKEQNKQLYEALKQEKKKPISYTLIQAQPETKIDTITIRDTIRDGNPVRIFKDFYPNKQDPFITYSGEINKDKIVGKFDLDTLNIGIVVSEKKKGLFEADLDAPDWLNLQDITVNSLPLENIRKDRFDWMLGGSAGLNFEDQTPVVEVEGGFRWNKKIFSVEVNTNKELKGGIKVLF